MRGIERFAETLLAAYLTISNVSDSSRPWLFFLLGSIYAPLLGINDSCPLGTIMMMAHRHVAHFSSVEIQQHQLNPSL